MNSYILKHIMKLAEFNMYYRLAEQFCIIGHKIPLNLKSSQSAILQVKDHLADRFLLYYAFQTFSEITQMPNFSS